MMFGYTIIKKKELSNVRQLAEIGLQGYETAHSFERAVEILPEWAKQRFWNYYNFYDKALPFLEKEKATITRLQQASDMSGIPFSTLKRYWYSYKTTGEV